MLWAYQREDAKAYRLRAEVKWLPLIFNVWAC